MADIAIQPVWQVLDGNGTPLPGAKVTFYNTGTVTPQTVYQDTGLTIPHASPVVANGNGVMPAVYLTGSVVAKAVITTSADVAVATIDPLPADALTSSSATQISFTPSVVNVTTNVQDAIDDIDDRIGAVSAYAKTLLDDANAAAALTTLGVSAFVQTLLNDADRVAFFATLGGVNTFAVVQTTTLGTAFDFTGIPSWATEVGLLLASTSLSGTDDFLVQVGDSGGVETTGYVSSSSGYATGVSTVTSTSGYILYQKTAASGSIGLVSFLKIPGTETWVSSHAMSGTGTNVSGGGIKTLSATLDRLRLTRTGTDTFDAGSAVIFYR